MPPLDDLPDEALLQQLKRSLQLPDAPESWITRAVSLSVAAGPAQPADRLTQVLGVGLRRLHAVLGFDSWAAPALALGVRSASATTRHLLFNAEGRDVDLRIVEADGSYELSGQILGPDEAGMVTAHYPAAGDGSTIDAVAGPQAALDEMGEFRLAGVRPGPLLLRLQVGGDEVVLPLIVLGPQP